MPIEIKTVVDASRFSRLHSGREAPLWWGIVGLILIEMTVVSAFVVSYFYLQMRADQWPPPSVPLPEVTIPTISLVLLLCSCGTMYMAGQSIKRNRRRHFVAYTLASVLLACTVLLIRWQKFRKLEFRWDEHVYGSLVWVISGFHFVHVVSAAIGTFVIALAGMAGYYSRERQIGITVDTMYWYFVSIAWIPFYFVLYWVPRLV